MVTVVIFLIAAAILSCIFFLTGTAGLPGSLLLFLAFFLAEHVLYILFFGSFGFFVSNRSPIEKQSRICRWICANTTNVINYYFGIRAEVIGGEKIPTDSRFLFICNHRSLFDPLIVIDKLRDYNISFISKPSNFRIPFAGRIIYAAGYLPIDRENNRNALTTILTASDYLKKDICSIGIYPEGTRSKTAELLPFHAGSFKIAQKAHVPIVVASISGTEKMKKAHLFAANNVKLTILEVIPVETVVSSKTNDLSEHARGLIEAELRSEE